ncbi:hypothetical protein [Ramlibacter alkalitolerans]|uniref:SCP2 domain-containing protein n=1 Tax=Ramlibacter alkalitolerans TaxID=2039631 RepID=A0ABS1JU25_9BURK|nr:hypothetical protein [Ramlibacter alkalitolerans]MBL0427723.1 hypothetical protein [Ramlibacter alkalitolerans]
MPATSAQDLTPDQAALAGVMRFMEKVIQLDPNCSFLQVERENADTWVLHDPQDGDDVVLELDKGVLTVEKYDASGTAYYPDEPMHMDIKHFGLAKAFEVVRDVMGYPLGTPGFTPPVLESVTFRTASNGTPEALVRFQGADKPVDVSLFVDSKGRVLGLKPAMMDTLGELLVGASMDDVNKFVAGMLERVKDERAARQAPWTKVRGGEGR